MGVNSIRGNIGGVDEPHFPTQAITSPSRNATSVSHISFKLERQTTYFFELSLGKTCLNHQKANNPQTPPDAPSLYQRLPLSKGSMICTIWHGLRQVTFLLQKAAQLVNDAYNKWNKGRASGPKRPPRLHAGPARDLRVKCFFSIVQATVPGSRYAQVRSSEASTPARKVVRDTRMLPPLLRHKPCLDCIYANRSLGRTNTDTLGLGWLNHEHSSVKLYPPEALTGWAEERRGG